MRKSVSVDGVADLVIWLLLSGERIAHAAQVRGFAYMRMRSQPVALCVEKKAPESIHRGMRMRFMTAWKPCVDSLTQAKATPTPVMAMQVTASASVIWSRATGVMCPPSMGSARRRMMACANARMDPPSIFPAAMDHLGDGATSTDWSQPSVLSSMMEMEEKMAVNMATSVIMPGRR